jgi:hypothetical protein
MNTDIDVGTVSFLSLDSLNVHHEFLSVDLHNFAYLVAFVVASNNLKPEIRLLDVFWGYVSIFVYVKILWKIKELSTGIFREIFPRITIIE